MSANVLTVAKKIRRQASKGYRSEQVQLLGAIGASDATLITSTTLPAGMIAGTVLGLDLELALVVSADRNSNTVTVVRGYQDTTATTHAAGSLIDVGPRFSLVDIVDAMADELAAWPSTLYYPLSVELSVATSAVTVQLPVSMSALMGLCEVRQSETAATSVTVWPRLACKLLRGDAATFSAAPTSGILLRFTEPIRTGAVYVTAAMPFGPVTLTSTMDLTTDLSMTDGMVELLSMGVKRRLLLDEMSGKMSRQVQDESRRAEETPIGSLVPLNQLQLLQYNRRINEEVARLTRLYPIRIV